MAGAGLCTTTCVAGQLPNAKIFRLLKPIQNTLSGHCLKVKLFRWLGLGAQASAKTCAQMRCAACTTVVMNFLQRVPYA